MTYEAAKAEAREKANRLGLSVGIGKAPISGYFTRLLPKPELRFGEDLRLECVDPDPKPQPKAPTP